MSTTTRRPSNSNRPRVGSVFRDDANRSLVVVKVDPSHLLVEFADGTIRRISHEHWNTMQPEPAAF